MHVRIVNAAAAIVAVLGIALVPPLSRADTALQLGGTPLPSYISWFVDTPVYPLNPQYFAQYTFVDVPYPQTIGPFSGLGTPSMGESVATGRAHLETAINATAGKILVIGNSQGSLPADDERARLAKDPNAPSPNRLSFLVNGDPEQRGGLFDRLFGPGTYIPILNYTTVGQVDSQYDLVVFANEYDGIADFPDRPWNLLASLNALFGVAYLHAATGSLNPYTVPAEDVTVTVNPRTGATTTTYRAPAQHLPLLIPLRILGVHSDVVDALEALLRPIVDAGYSRNDTGLFHGATFTGGQFHLPWIGPSPAPTPAPVQTPVSTGGANLLTAAGGGSTGENVDDSHGTDGDADANGPVGTGSPMTAGRSSITVDDAPEVTPSAKRRPQLNVVRDSFNASLDEKTDGVSASAGDGENTGEHVEADPSTTESDPIAAPTNDDHAGSPGNSDGAQGSEGGSNEGGSESAA